MVRDAIMIGLIAMFISMLVVCLPATDQNTEKVHKDKQELLSKYDGGGSDLDKLSDKDRLALEALRLSPGEYAKLKVQYDEIGSQMNQYYIAGEIVGILGSWFTGCIFAYLKLI